MSLLPITLLTGFLGSGKTTVLNYVLSLPDLANSAVLINEFGDVGLDHLLVRTLSDDVIQLNSGCVCCTVRGDLVESLRDLHIRRVKGECPEFQRVMIETTGMADPAPIIHTLMSDPYLTAYFRLDGIVSTIDSVNGSATLDQQIEAVKQAAVADRLVLTKCDLAPPQHLAALQERLRTLNPAAPQIQAQMGELDPKLILNAGLFQPNSKIPDVQHWLRAEAYPAVHHGHQCDAHCTHDHHHEGHHHEEHHGHGGHGGHRHDQSIHSFVYICQDPVDWPALAFALQLLTSQFGEHLLRIKGILNVIGQEQPLAIHGVQHIFHPPATLAAWPDDDRRTRLVFITRDLRQSVITDMLKGVLDLGGFSSAH